MEPWSFVAGQRSHITTRVQANSGCSCHEQSVLGSRRRGLVRYILWMGKLWADLPGHQLSTKQCMQSTSTRGSPRLGTGAELSSAMAKGGQAGCGDCHKVLSGKSHNADWRRSLAITIQVMRPYRTPPSHPTADASSKALSLFTPRQVGRVTVVERFPRYPGRPQH